MQKALEDKSINILSAELQRIPMSINELDDAAADDIGQLVGNSPRQPCYPKSCISRSRLENCRKQTKIRRYEKNESQS